MKNWALLFGVVLAAALPAAAQDATAPATTTVVNESCAGSDPELCQDAQAQQQPPGVQKHVGFDPLPTPPPSATQAPNLPNFTPPPTPTPQQRPTLPQQPPTAIPATIVLAPPANAPDGSPPVTIQTQPDAPTQ